MPTTTNECLYVLNYLIFRCAIKRKGYKVSHSHCNPDVIKTDMRLDEIYGLLKFWLISSNADAKFAIEGVNPVEGDFTVDRSMIADSKKEGLKRFPENPKNWGPMARHKAN